MLGCGQPAGEAGFNIAQWLPSNSAMTSCRGDRQPLLLVLVADHPDGFHAIKAGEGSAFISAGVKPCRRFPNGTSDGWPGLHNPLFADAEARTAAAAPRAQRPGTTPGGRAAARRLHSDGSDRRERGPVHRHQSGDQDRWGVRSQNRAEEAIKNGFFAREISPGHAAGRHRGVDRRRPRAGTTYEAVSQLQPVFRPTERSPPGNACPLNDGRRR